MGGGWTMMLENLSNSNAQLSSKATSGAGEQEFFSGAGTVLLFWARVERFRVGLVDLVVVEGVMNLHPCLLLVAQHGCSSPS